MLDKPMGDRLNQAKHWQAKADECRAIADRMKEPMADAVFRRMALTYDHLAEQWQHRAREGIGSAS